MRSHILITAAALAATAVLLASSALAAPAAQGVAQEKQFSEWVKVLEPHLRAVWNDGGDPQADEPQPFDWRHHAKFLVRLDGPGEPANAYNIPGGAALVSAARVYALLTGDFEVTLGDLERSGWWPYATIPQGISREAVVVKTDGGLVLDKFGDLKHVGSPEWVLRAKFSVLSDFYSDFFFRVPVKQIEMGQAQTGSIDSKPRNEKVWVPDYEAKVQPRTPADLPQRLAGFWVNPYTGAPMVVSDKPGDLSIEDISFYSQNATAVQPDGQVNQGGHFYYSGEDGGHPPKLEVAQVSWKNWGKAEPWSARVGGTAPALPQWLTSDTDSPQMQAHTAKLLAAMEPADKWGITHELSFDATGERAPLEELACPQALALAAFYYAITTADTQVSLRDIVDAGFWPYDTFPTWLDLSETLYDFPREESWGLNYSAGGFTNGVANGPRWNGYLANDMGTPQWLLWRKAEILNQVHAELFFNTRADYTPAQGIDPRTADVFPRFAAFWTNPVASAAAGKPVAFEFGPLQGQLGTVDVNLLRPLYAGAHIRYEQQVPLINLADKTQFVAGGTPQFIYRERNLSGVTEQGRAWVLPQEQGGGLGEIRWSFTQPVTVSEKVLLDVGWDPPRPTLGIDGKPQPESWQSGVYRFKQGDDLGNGNSTGPWIEGAALRIVYDSVAPLVKRYQLEWKQQPRDYFMLQQMVRQRGAPVSLPGGRAGIDELVALPEAALEVAAK